MGKLKNRPPNQDRRPIAPAVPQTIFQRRAEIIYKMDHGFKAGDLADMYDLSESSNRRIYKERHQLSCDVSFLCELSLTATKAVRKYVKI
ncbi:hypothetical protein RvY_03910 [Ramazzottius varieornatus]|uniref:Uncharacterized protein n=1 Tax=Ramazzottius varieornatus TaxID=947166 RepID=A0A1D1UPR7_RAMVA|nr:hypothetical protein RvY_03910 [Ramazzottius varieornatus]